MTPSQRSQYHHFVPRFILRNFKSEEKPANAPAGSHPVQGAGWGRGRGRGRRRGYNPKDGEITHLNLKNMQIESHSLSRLFGLVDMYKVDVLGAADSYHLEQKLSQLEGEAANLIRKARDTFAKNDNLILSRYEKDCLRRFFFLMKYRGTRQYARFNHASIDTYSANDKTRMQEYMQRKGFASPMEVWQANLDVFLTIEMDAGQEWRKKVLALAFEDDAKMFIYHVESRYMTFCRSNPQEREFVLTENAYSIHEGLQSLVDGGPYTEYHTFAPIDPHLMIVFRSHVLRNHLDSQKQEEKRQSVCRLSGLDPLGHSSTLDDLPVVMPQAQYAGDLQGEGLFHTTSDPVSSVLKDNDKFTFQCFTIAHRHVELINDVLLEQAHSQTLVACRDSMELARAARAYLLRRRKGFKLVVKNVDKHIERYLLALGKFASRTLGIPVDPVYKTINPLNVDIHMSFYVAGHVAKAIRMETRSDPARIYRALDSGQCMYLTIKSDKPNSTPRN